MITEEDHVPQLWECPAEMVKPSPGFCRRCPSGSSGPGKEGAVHAARHQSQPHLPALHLGEMQAVIFIFFPIPPKKLPLCHRGAAARLGGCSLASTGEPSTSTGWRGRGTRGTGKVASRGWAVLAASVCSIFCKHHPLERHLHIAWRPGCCWSADYGFLITQGLMWNII